MLPSEMVLTRSPAALKTKMRPSPLTPEGTATRIIVPRTAPCAAPWMGVTVFTARSKGFGKL